MDAGSKNLSDLLSRIKSKIPELAAKIEADYRQDLDAKTSILDLSYNALIVNVYRGKKLSNREIDAYNQIYEKLLQVVKTACASKTFPSLDDPGFLKKFNAKASAGAILIDNGRDDVFLVGKNFDAIRSFVTKYISKNPELRASRFGEKTIFEPIVNIAGKSTGSYKRVTRSKLDIGHIPAEDNENLTSPLESKIKAVLEYGTDVGSARIQSIANNALKRLYEVQLDISYNFKNTAPEAIAKARKTFASGYIVLTLHTQKKNNEFAVLEKRIYDKLLAELALSLNLVDVPGSNTIREDIVESLVSILAGSKKKLKTHKVQTGTTSTKLKSNISVKTSKPKLPDVRHYRTAAAKTTNLISLQNLINRSLVQQVKQNMGTGTRRDILNLRSGRFAESVKIERMTQSREGMITAFYSYMKNPYATFSTGGLQGSPKTRDPKLLIAKSIRELATQQVQNRLRSVVV